MILADIATLWGYYVWPALLLVFGFGLVIFVHELGHFLAAKCVDVRVDRFALGFGPRLFGIKKGETDYCIKLLPLGGYVKMLGQEDFDAMEEGSEAVKDPRNFMNKSIRARLFIVSAGVVMNVIFASILFVVVCMSGIDFVAPIVGGTAPGYPAATVVTSFDQPASRPATAPASRPDDNAAGGLQPGDRVLAVNGKKITSFDKIGLTAALADKDEIFHVTFERNGKVHECDLGAKSGSGSRLVFQDTVKGYLATTADLLGETDDEDDFVGLQPGDRVLAVNGKKITSFDKIGLIAVLADEDEIFHVTFERNGHVGQCDMGVKWGSQGRLMFGIIPPVDLVVGEPADENFVTKFKPGDRVVAITTSDGNTRKIEHYWEIEPIERKLDGRDVKVTVLRDGKETDVTVRPVARLARARVLFAKDDHTFFQYKKAVLSDDGKTIAVTTGHGKTRTLDAEKYQTGRANKLDVLGLIPRLRVVSVLEGSRADKAGLKAGDIIVRYADNPSPTFTELQEINKRFADDGDGTTITVIRGGKQLDPLRIVPAKRDGPDDETLYQIGIHPGLDLAHTVVAHVRPGSAAEDAKLMAGDVIVEIGDEPTANWNEIIIRRSKYIRGKVPVKYTRGGQDRSTVIDVTKAAFLPNHYRFSIFAEQAVFEPLKTARVQMSNPLDAVAWGLTQTWDMLVMNYASIRSMMRGTVSAKQMRGPVGIVGLGMEVGRRGVIELTYFLAIISVCLAVFNFLPLPLVDGGLAVILAVEKVRGKPLSVRATNIITVGGIVLILAIFAAVTWNDIARLLQDSW